MDLKTEMILEQYDENLETYQIMERIIKDVINSAIESHNIFINSVETRIKTRKSLEGKLTIKGYKYNTIEDITDIVGARVVTFYSDDVDLFASHISGIFEIDWQNTVDKRKLYEVDRFGYMSLHYICRIPKTLYYDENNPKINTIRFELQMRTALQHVWASIYHDTGYKSDVEIPKENLRYLSRLAGLLEIADQQFNDVKHNLNDYRRKVKSIISDGNFDEVELNADSFKAYIETGTIQSLNNKIAQIYNMEIKDVPYTPYLKALKKAGFSTLGDVENLRKKYSEQAYQFAIKQFSDTELDIMASTVGIQNLLYVYVIDIGGGIVGIKLLLDTIYGERKINERMARRIVEIGKSIGLTRKED